MSQTLSRIHEIYLHLSLLQTYIIVVKIHQDNSRLPHNKGEPHDNIAHSWRHLERYDSQRNLHKHASEEPYSEHLEGHTDQVFVEKGRKQEHSQGCLNFGPS